MESLTINDTTPPYRRGDVVIQISDDEDGRYVWPPGVVFSDPLKVGRRRYVMQLLRYDDDLEPYELAEAEALWRRARRPGRLDKTRWLKEPADRRVTLGLWKLSEASG